MPVVNIQTPIDSSRETVRVLITGFGPFAGYKVNPSWLAVRPLHNTILQPDSDVLSISPVTHKKAVLSVGSMTESIASLSFGDKPPSTLPAPTPSIHITTLKVPVTYEAVLATVPGFHTRPPALPNCKSSNEDDADEPLLPHIAPPADGYDLILHVGVAGPGAMRIEVQGHKLSYQSPDADGKYAPIVKKVDEPETKPGKNDVKEDEAEKREKERAGRHKDTKYIRGFAEGYEKFAEELQTDLDVDELVDYLQANEINLVHRSMNAGRYLCDFIYYCSLAEAKRTRSKFEADPTKGGKKTKVLFLHCPPVDDPLSTEDVTDAIKQIVAWVFTSPAKD